MKKFLLNILILLSFSSLIIAQPYDEDIQLFSINCPNGNYYYGSELQFPSVTIKNIGLNQIEQVNVYYSIDDNAEVMRNITGMALMTNQTRNILFSQIELTPGNHTISARVEIIGYTDENISNNVLNANYYYGGPDIGTVIISAPSSDYCGFGQLSPAVWVKNYSNISINTFTAYYRLDFYPVVSQNFTETIAPGDSVLISFNPLYISSGDHSIQFGCSNPNGILDSNLSNNSIGTNFNFSNGKHILISILTDSYGGETSWDLKNALNQIIASGSGFAANTLYEYNLCLNTECFLFTIYDSFGDGICSGFGNGYYKIEDVDEDLVIGTGCNFTNTATVNFCVETPPGPPIANFYHDNTDNCTGEVAFLDNSACNPAATAWLWNFGDGSTSTEQNPTHTYIINGYYSVGLQVTNSNGTSQLTIPNFIEINKTAPPLVEDEHFCFGQNVSFFAPIGVDQLNWYSTPNETTPIQSGTNMSFAGLTNDTSIYYEYVVQPEINYVGLTDNSGVGGYFNFSIDRVVYFDALTDIVIKTATVFASGEANRTFTLKNSVGTTIDTRVINIPDGESVITLDFEIPQGNNYAIHLNTVNYLSYTGDYGGPNVGYPFTVPNVISITGNNFGNNFWYFLYDIEVQTGLGGTCISNRAEAMAIMSPQIVSIGNDTLICNGNSINLSPALDYTNYTWSTGSHESSVEIANSGEYSVTVVDEYTCTATGSVDITIADELFYDEHIQYPSVIGGNDGSIEIEIISGSEPYEIVWDNSATDFTLTNLIAGYYYYTITDGENCEHTGIIEIFSSVGILDNIGLLIDVYPNPATNSLTIENTTDENLQIVIYDLNSKLLIDKITHSKVSEIDISDFKPGIYFINIKGKDFSINKKIIKE